MQQEQFTGTRNKGSGGPDSEERAPAPRGGYGCGGESGLSV